jgi:hypothetical protein
MAAPETSADTLERIRKLIETADNFLAQSRDQSKSAVDREAFENEGNAMNARAFELAARAEIDMALARDRIGAEKETVRNRIFVVGRPFIQQTTLAYVVYDTFGCSLIDISVNRSLARKYGGEAKLGRVHAYGFDGDMQRADMLFTSLVLQAQREAARHYREYVDNFTPWACPECGEHRWEPVPMDTDWYYCTECQYEFFSKNPPQDKPDRRSVWYRSFWIGWVNALAPRIRAAHKKVQQVAEINVPGTAVALRDRNLAVKEAVESRYPDLRQRRRSSSKGSGYGAGREAGSQADIGQGRVGSRRNALPRSE